MTRLHKAAEPSQPVFLTTSTILHRYGGVVGHDPKGKPKYGVSRMWLTRRMEEKINPFPQPIKFGNSSTRLWRLSEIEAWEKGAGAVP